jgi:hypothetical protein
LGLLLRVFERALGRAKSFLPPLRAMEGEEELVSCGHERRAKGGELEGYEVISRTWEQE